MGRASVEDGPAQRGRQDHLRDPATLAGLDALGQLDAHRRHQVLMIIEPISSSPASNAIRASASERNARPAPRPSATSEVGGTGR
jgi:hypothetical protein